MSQDACACVVLIHALAMFGDADQFDALMDEHNELLGHARTALAADEEMTRGLEEIQRAVERALGADAPQDRADIMAVSDDDAQCIMSLFSRPIKHWFGTTGVGANRASLYELGTLVLGCFALQRRLGVTVLALDSVLKRMAHAGGVPDAAPERTVREIADVLHTTMRSPELLAPLGTDADAQVPNLLAMIGAVHAWEFGGVARAANVATLARSGACRVDERTHVRLRAELVAWLCTWCQVADLWQAWDVRLDEPRAADAEDAMAVETRTAAVEAWMGVHMDSEQRRFRSDAYQQAARKLTIELLAPTTTGAVYRRIFPLHSTNISIQTQLQRLESVPTLGLLCTRCTREYDGLEWMDPRAIAAAEAAERSEIARATARPDGVARDTVRAPLTAAQPWDVRLSALAVANANVPASQRSNAALMRMANAHARASEMATATGEDVAPLADTLAITSNPAHAAVGLHVAGAAAAAGAASASGASRAPLIPSIVAAADAAAQAPLPDWARCVTEDAWTLQAWFVAVDRILARILPGGAGTGIVGPGTCRARYFFRACGSGDAQPPAQTASGALPMLPVMFYLMPRVVVVRCHKCARAVQFTTARAAVAHWVTEVMGECHGGADEFGRPFITTPEEFTVL